uniref:BART domain-containing protein n=1 Tax=Hanusia phi TaxID=3032 RepID=A0A7S0EDA5_9CRYP|mmetsp:Transcript_2215/g.5125  ORF Transcript_2215/g.5125 Transcript_2215/m.5125 type:complete len:510 (+) Transcript_2215:77-1606(+)
MPFSTSLQQWSRELQQDLEGTIQNSRFPTPNVKSTKFVQLYNEISGEILRPLAEHGDDGQGATTRSKSWWPVYRWAIAYSSPTFHANLVSHMIRSCGANLFPSRKEAEKKKAEFTFIAMHARGVPDWDLAGHDLAGAIREQGRREYQQYEDKLFARLMLSTAEAKRHMIRNTLDLIWLMPGQDRKHLPDLPLLFAAQTETSIIRSFGLITVGEMIIRIQCAARGFISKRRFRRVLERCDQRREGAAFRLVEERRRFLRALVKVQSWTRQTMAARLVRRRKEAATCLQKLAKFCGSSAFTDAFSSFFRQYSINFRSVELRNEQELRFYELYKLFLVRFERVLMQFSANENVHYQDLLDYCEISYGAGNLQTRRFIQEMFHLVKYDSFLKLMRKAGLEQKGIEYKFKEQVVSSKILNIIGSSRLLAKKIFHRHEMRIRDMTMDQVENSSATEEEMLLNFFAIYKPRRTVLSSSPLSPLTKVCRQIQLLAREKMRKRRITRRTSEGMCSADQ